MTQPGDQSRVTRRVPRQSGVWSQMSEANGGPSVEPISDADAQGAIKDVNGLIDFMLQRHGHELPNTGTSSSFEHLAKAAFDKLFRYVGERQSASLATLQRFNDSRRQYGERIEQLQAELEQANKSIEECRAWIDTHDPMLVDNERVIEELESAKATLEAKHKQAQEEILRQTADIQQLTSDAARLRMDLADAQRTQESQRRSLVTQADEAHRVEVERLRQENDRLRADLARAEGKQSDLEATKRELGKARAERDKAQADVQAARAAEQKAIEAKLAATREFDAFKRQHGSAIVQPILVIPASDKVAAAQGKLPEELIKIFPRANFARFMVKVVEAAIRMAKGKATSYQLIDAVKLARTAEIDPFYQVEPATPSGDVLDMALSECQSWFTQLMLAFKEKGEQLDRLSAQCVTQRTEIRQVREILERIERGNRSNDM